MKTITDTNWHCEKLEDVAEIIMGQSPPGDTYHNYPIGLPFFQGKADFGDIYPSVRVYCSAPSRIAEKGDILISVRAPVGPTNLAATKCCIGRGLAAIRATSKLDNIYLLYYLRSIETQMVSGSRGSTFDSIGRDDIENILIPLPPLEEQQRIADLLARADRLRRLRRHALQLSNTFLQSLFLQMFGNDSGYDAVSFKDVIKIDRIKASEDEQKTLPYIGLEHIEKQTGRLTSEFCNQPQAMLATNYRFTRDHVLYGKLRPYLNKVIVPEFDGVCTTEILPLLPRKGKIEKYFLWIYLRSNKFVDWASGNVAGANLPRLSPELLNEHVLKLPPYQHQVRFSEFVSGIHRTMKKEEESSRQSEQLFQTLLHRAFAG